MIARRSALTVLTRMSGMFQGVRLLHRLSAAARLPTAWLRIARTQNILTKLFVVFPRAVGRSPPLLRPHHANLPMPCVQQIVRGWNCAMASWLSRPDMRQPLLPAATRCPMPHQPHPCCAPRARRIGRLHRRAHRYRLIQNRHRRPRPGWVCRYSRQASRLHRQHLRHLRPQRQRHSHRQ